MKIIILFLLLATPCFGQYSSVYNDRNELVQTRYRANDVEERRDNRGQLQERRYYYQGGYEVRDNRNQIKYRIEER